MLKHKTPAEVAKVLLKKAQIKHAFCDLIDGMESEPHLIVQAQAIVSTIASPKTGKRHQIGQRIVIVIGSDEGDVRGYTSALPNEPYLLVP